MNSDTKIEKVNNIEKHISKTLKVTNAKKITVSVSYCQNKSPTKFLSTTK